MNLQIYGVEVRNIILCCCLWLILLWGHEQYGIRMCFSFPIICCKKTITWCSLKTCYVSKTEGYEIMFCQGTTYRNMEMSVQIIARITSVHIHEKGSLGCCGKSFLSQNVIVLPRDWNCPNLGSQKLSMNRILICCAPSVHETRIISKTFTEMS